MKTLTFFRLLTREGDMEYTGCGNYTEALRLEYCLDYHLAQICLRKRAGEHVLHCDGSLKGLAMPRI
jgi:hypothetical protein